MKPLAVDLFCGLFGWGEALAKEGYQVVGFDLEDMRHQFGFDRIPNTSLVIQDVRTLHGSQLKDAALICASPPCQRYSWMAMPWKRAKAAAAAIRADTTGQMLADLNCLFDACFRIQGQASLAAGRHIPMIVENVKGAQPWVGRARWNWGSYFLWGNVPALMPPIGARKFNPDRIDHPTKNSGGSWFAVAHNTTSGHSRNPDGRKVAEGRKGAGAGAGWFDANLCQFGSGSPQRKMASAMIARIPQPLARHIAATFRP